MTKRTKILLSLILSIFICTVLSITVLAAYYGDIDGNGAVEASDARLALRSAVGLETLTEAQKAIGDVDGNGAVEAADARLILRAAVGLEQLKESVTGCTHTYGAWTTEKNSSRVNTGYHIRTCSKCNAAEKAACTFDENNKAWKTANREPTCTEAARYSVACTVCSGAKLVTVPATGHSERVIPGIDPTCTQAGKAVGYECYVCKNIRGNEVLAPLGHNVTTAWSVSADGKNHYRCCQRAGCDYKEQHTGVYVIENAATGFNVPTLVCPVCHTVMADNKEARVEAFNGMVNTLKTAYAVTPIEKTPELVYPRLTYFSRTVMSSTVSDIDFGAYTKAVEDLYAKEMEGTVPTYSQLYKGKSLFWLPLTDNLEHNISELTAADVNTITVEYKEKVSGSDILKNYPDTYTVGSDQNATTYSIKDCKTKEFTNVIKVTVKVNEVDASTVTDFNAIKNADSNALSNFTDTDIREDLSQYTGENYVYTEIESDEDEAVYRIQMDMQLTRIKSNGNCTYYFDADTLAPIAAVYYTSVEMWQNLAMDFRLLNSELLGASGTMKPYVQTEYDQVYLFTPYFTE